MQNNRMGDKQASGTVPPRVPTGSVKSKRLKTKRIYLVTWNVGGKPPPANLRSLFQLEKNCGADIYGIGLQEAGYQDWCGALDEALRKDDVVRIKWRRILGIVIAVYVKHSLLPHITRIESEATRTGLAGMWGNKGGVSVRMQVLGLTIIIVNCHLAAHMENVAARMKDIDSILDTQKFRDQTVGNILDHDYVFWMGDLNFRVDDIDCDDALATISNGRHLDLLKTDQLKTVMKEALVFENFQEADISFPPTYKFDIGTDVYDTSSKQRVPAYCDRVLYHFYDTTYGKNKLGAKVVNYTSHPSFQMSDHKPVSCLIDYNVLHRPPPSLAIFQLHPGYSRRQSLTVHYRLQHPFYYSSYDWIAIFKENFMSFDDYLNYSWVKGATDSVVSDVLTCSIIFPVSTVSALPSNTGFVLCYFSKKYSLCGVSSVFKVTSQV